MHAIMGTAKAEILNMPQKSKALSLLVRMSLTIHFHLNMDNAKGMTINVANSNATDKKYSATVFPAHPPSWSKSNSKTRTISPVTIQIAQKSKSNILFVCRMNKTTIN